MSSNYKILLYLLKTLDQSLKVGLGLRETQNFYSRLNQPFVTLNKKVVSNKTGVQQVPKRNDNSQNLNINSLVDDAAIVVEGLRQYASYAAKHSTPFSTRLGTSPIVPGVPTLPHLTKQVTQELVKDEAKILEVENSSTQSRPEDLLMKSVNVDGGKKSLYSQTVQSKLSEKSKERKVPANRASRVLSFGGLAINLGFGAIEELSKRVVGLSNQKSDSILGSSVFLSESNALKIVDTLCRVRGAALKLGQMLSIQDNEILGPEIQAIFERVRQSADYMPESQMRRVMSEELGDNWPSLFRTFDSRPFAAASIGQVHRAELLDGSVVAVKIQYPGVAESIESDIKNVLSILKYANVFPEGLFIDHIMAYAKKELGWEVDYVREASCAQHYRALVEQYCQPNERFQVPNTYKSLSTKRVLTTQMITGIPVDQLEQFSETSVPQVKNWVLERMLRLFFRELFLFNYMQTDPNWSNFFYDHKTDTLALIDFGSSRSYSKEFVNKYMSIINAAIDNDRESVLSKSEDIGFLSGYESDIFKQAHIDSVMIIGEAIREPNEFKFGCQSVTKKIHNLVPVMLRHRLKPPPEEIYSLHRKLSGLFLLFTKLNAEINCRKVFEKTIAEVEFYHQKQ